MQYLERIDALEGLCGAFETIDSEGALASAREIDTRLGAGEDLGPLMGVPVAVKDLCVVDGMPLTAGSSLAPDVLQEIAGGSAEGSVMRSLRAAGCVILGTTKTVEWAFSPTGVSGIVKQMLRGQP